MKLIHCNQCGEVFSLRLGEWKTCRCESSGGKYVDIVWAIYYGPCFVFGMNNYDLEKASDASGRFSAEWYTILEGCHITRVKGKEGENEPGE